MGICYHSDRKLLYQPRTEWGCTLIVSLNQTRKDWIWKPSKTHEKQTKVTSKYGCNVRQELFLLMEQALWGGSG